MHTHCSKGSSSYITRHLQRAGISDKPWKIMSPLGYKQIWKGKVERTYYTWRVSNYNGLYSYTFVILINYSGLNSIPLRHSKIPIDLKWYDCCHGVIDFLESVFFIQSRTILTSLSSMWSSGSCHLPSFCLSFSYDYEYKESLLGVLESHLRNCLQS